MAKLSGDKDIAYLAAEHQANLMLLAASWGAAILDSVRATDNELTGTIPGLLEEAGGHAFSSATVKRYEEIRKEILRIRARGYLEALEYALKQSELLMENEIKWAAALAKLTQAQAKLQKLSKQDIRAMVQYSFVSEGNTIKESFGIAQENDARRIVEVCKSGMAQGKAISDIVKGIRGSKENNFEDGTLQASRKEAEAIARTTCGAIADEAKMRFYMQNSDVVLGTKHIATLSGNTCLRCAVYDGMVWKLPEEADQVPKLGIHINCRCVHIPVTELSKLNGSTRPAEAANFWKEAEKAYRKKYPGKDWNSLSRSTRLRYYYQAQKDYEKRTGKPAFEQVPQNMSFSEWLKTKDDAYVQSYLGPARYKLYRAGNLPLNKFINPITNRAFTVKELKERDKAAFQDA